MGDRIKFVKARPVGKGLPDFFNEEAYRDVKEFHTSMEEYAPTPLLSLGSLAERLGVKGIYVKDESKRFGLNAFKGLGGSYAIHKIIEKDGPANRVFVTATDGNHGRGVAWAAHRCGGKAYVFMPKGTVEVRAQAIRSIGDTFCQITDETYDRCVEMARRFAEENGYHLVQDTGFEGYEEIPNNITLGYTTMADEAMKQLEKAGEKKVTHIFLQAGVGSMAGGVLGYFVDRYEGKPPVTVIVEANGSECHLLSAQKGEYTCITDGSDTLMAGLNCGSPNIFTWPILRDNASWFASCPDSVTIEGMKKSAHPEGDDPLLISGESGAVDLGLLLRILEREEYGDQKKAMGFDEDSVILLFSTEGNTDPEHFEQVTGLKI